MRSLIKIICVFCVLLLISGAVIAQTQAPTPAPTAPTGLDMKMIQNVFDKRAKEIDSKDVEIEILTAQRDFYRGRVAELEIEVSKLKVKSQ